MPCYSLAIEEEPALTAIPAAAVVASGISMIRSRERCLLVFLSAAAGLVLLLGAIGFFFI